jgi:hypothetical protein
MQIECAAGFLVSNAKIEQRYKDALAALWPAVVIPIVNQCVEALAEGRSFWVGDVSFDKSGLLRLVDRWDEVERDQKFLAWADYGGHNSSSGNIHLFRDKKSWASLSLRDTWNAVCLDPLFSYLYEERKAMADQ